MKLSFLIAGTALLWLSVVSAEAKKSDAPNAKEAGPKNPTPIPPCPMEPPFPDPCRPIPM